MIVSLRHDQREKPNNLKLIQQTKVLIRNQLVDKAKARLPTFSHNLHLVVHYISLTLKNIHQITTCRLFEKKASLPDISMGKSTEPLKKRQHVSAEMLTTDWSIPYRGDAYADRSPLDFGDVGHAEIIRDVNFT